MYKNWRPVYMHLGRYCTSAAYIMNNTVTPFKFAAIKVRGFEIMTYWWPFNFAVSYQNYFMVSYANVVFSYHKLKNARIIYSMEKC